jgi:DNA-binding CsgD family transcriptional regulator
MDRQEIENLLRRNLEEAKKSYALATEESQHLMDISVQHSDLKDPSWRDGLCAMPKALRIQLQAQQRYLRALKGFTDFIVHGKMPRPSDPAEALPVPVRAYDCLTARELQVLKLIASGLSSKEIGVQLGISFKTVICHRTRLMEKLDIHNVAGLVRYAIAEKLIEP